MQIALLGSLIVTLLLLYFSYSLHKKYKALRYMMLDTLLDPQKHHEFRHDLLRPVSSSTFSGKLILEKANKTLITLSLNYMKKNKNSAEKQTKLIDQVLKTYD